MNISVSTSSACCHCCLSTCGNSAQCSVLSECQRGTVGHNSQVKVKVKVRRKRKKEARKKEEGSKEARKMSRSAGASSSEDPFYAVRDNVQSLVDRIKVRAEKFQDMAFHCNTANNIEFKETRKALVKDIRGVDKQIKDLRGAVDMTEKNRDKFTHITDAELNQRKRFVEDMNRIVSDIKATMESEAIKRKMEDDENKSKAGSGDPNFGAVTNIEKKNSDFIRGQQQVTKETIAQQDVQLDHLGRAVDRLDGIGRTINTELKDQNRMLNELETDMGQAEERMNFVMGKLQKLLKTKDNCQIYSIVVLAIILIVLVALVIFV